jgi:hypothetical protein
MQQMDTCSKSLHSNYQKALHKGPRTHELTRRSRIVQHTPKHVSHNSAAGDCSSVAGMQHTFCLYTYAIHSTQYIDYALHRKNCQLTSKSLSSGASGNTPRASASANTASASLCSPPSCSEHTMSVTVAMSGTSPAARIAASVASAALCCPPRLHT